MSRETIHTDNAPAAVGTYSQAVKVGDLVFISGQIPFVPEAEWFDMFHLLIRSRCSQHNGWR